MPLRIVMCAGPFFAQANSVSPLAPASKANLIALFRSMRSSTAFYQPISWVSTEFRATWFDPIFAKSKSKRSNSWANLATHSSAQPNQTPQ